MNKYHQPGFTLIEILIYIALVSGILIAASTFAWNIIGSKTKTQTIQEVQGNGYLVMEHVNNVIRSGRDINATSSLNINLADNANAGKFLSLSMRNGAVNPTIIDVVNGVVRMRQGTGSAVALSSNLVRVTNLTFTDRRDPAGKTKNIEILLTIENINPQNTSERAATLTLQSADELLDIPR